MALEPGAVGAYLPGERELCREMDATRRRRPRLTDGNLPWLAVMEALVKNATECFGGSFEDIGEMRREQGSIALHPGKLRSQLSSQFQSPPQ